LIIKENCILQVALSTPIRKIFDYLPPEPFDPHVLKTGIRVRVPFGKGEKVGVLLDIKSESLLPKAKLKHAISVLDQVPLFDKSIMMLYQFASQYYQHAMGEIIFSSLPPLLREGQPASLPEEIIFTLTELGAKTEDDEFRHAIQQRKIMTLLKAHPNGLSREEILANTGEQKALTALLAKGYLKKYVIKRSVAASKVHNRLLLNEYQQAAVSAITAQEGFATYLLEGVTGSGKTEVYLQCIEAVLKNNKQALVLVPEIGLTPQTVARFQERFNLPISILHSGLNDKERNNAWLLASDGTARIIIGTRSAVLTPLPALGLIILDEEHDVSFKQQSGFRYSARDLAIMRGKLTDVPVVLGTATPCLESLFNVKQKRFLHLNLPVRAGHAIAPSFHLIDVRSTPLEEGFSPIILQKMQEHLSNNGQVLVFLNRRGYAPTLLCHQCGWIASCSRCDARLTYHAELETLICHHCAAIHRIDKKCGACHSREILLLGVGTQRVEKFLTHHFPKANITRIDRDSTRKKGAMAKMLAYVQSGESNILIGTQMLAKGHHFPDVTMVVITDIDTHLYSTDFRACERLGQLIVQVAGRAGRSERPGEVYLQTHNPNHPLLLQLIKSGYSRFAEHLLKERKSADLPPFSHLALFRAQGTNPNLPQAFLSDVRNLFLDDSEVSIFGPIPALMEKKAGKFRAQLLVQTKKRPYLQKLLQDKMSMIEALPSARKVRWSIDIDPIDVLS
jgi:primosomal protein N' (replication factor Y)